MNQIKNAIEEAGWYEDRKIDISWMIDEYVRVGFNKPNELIQDFLAEYGNIRIDFTNDEGFWSDIRINPEVGMQFLESEDSRILEQIVGDLLLPIGSIHNGIAGLLISFSGNFYLLADNGLYELGSNLLETCESVFLQKPVRQLTGSQEQ